MNNMKITKKNNYYELCNSNRGTFYFNPKCIAEEIDKNGIKFYEDLFERKSILSNGIPIQNLYRSYITYRLYKSKDDFTVLLYKYRKDILKYLFGFTQRYFEFKASNICMEFTDSHVVCYREKFKSNDKTRAIGREFLWDIDLNGEYELWDVVNNLF